MATFAITIVLAIVGTLIIAYLVKAITGLPPTAVLGCQSLDRDAHGD